MKTLKLLIGLFCTLFLCVYGCDDDSTDYDPAKLPSEFSALTGTTEAVTIFTRAALNDLLRVTWSEGDQIGIFAREYRNVIYRAEKLVAETAIFEGEKFSGDIDTLYAYFPYDASAVMEGTILTVTLPEVQTYQENNFDEKGFPMVAVATTQSVMFRNLCGIARINVKDTSIKTIKSIKFFASGNNIVAGKATVDLGSYTGVPGLTMEQGGSQVLTLDCGESGIDMQDAPAGGVNFYLILPPQQYENVILLLENTDEETFIQKIEDDLVVDRSKIVDLPSFIPYSEDVFYGRSNAILRETPGTHTFDVSPYYTTDAESYSYQFNTSPIQAVASSVKLIWQDTPDMITRLKLIDDGHSVEFTASTNGNALVAIYDNKDEILWSFHIWISDVSTVEYPNGYQVMDRNLGAISVQKGDLASWGLYYQWGRKDPFAASNRIENNFPIAAPYYDINNNPFIFPDAIETTPGIDQNYTTKNPTTYISSSTGVNPGDWYFGSNNSLWGNPLGFNNPPIENLSKSIYDPCPEGFMVAPADLFTGNGVEQNSSNNFVLDTGKRGRTLITDGQNEWYPAARHLKPDGTRNVNGDFLLRYWLSSPGSSHHQSMSLTCGPANNVFPTQSQNKVLGFSVRCVRYVK